MSAELVDIRRPNVGPQQAFLACDATEVLYGGAAGGGKSFAIMVDPLRHVQKRGFASLVLRRTFQQLKKSGGLLEHAWNLYPRLGAEPKDGGLSWFWPGGGRVDLAGMDHENDRYNYQGSEYAEIAFDELPQFTETQYLYMFSRLRSSAIDPDTGQSFRLRMRSTGNPDGEHLEWVYRRWIPWVGAGDDSYSGVTARAGEVLFYRFDRERERFVRCNARHPDAFSRTFIPSSWRDTPQLRGTAYETALNMLDPLTRARLRDGNWHVRANSGIMFQRSWWSVERGTLIDRLPPANELVARIRRWDLAATEANPKKMNGRQAATAGVRMSLWRDGSIIVEDIERVWERPAAVHALISSAADTDDRLDDTMTTCMIVRDPGQAGVDQVRMFARELRSHDVRFETDSGDKVERAKPFSAACERGDVKILAKPGSTWVEDYLRELVAFPGGLKDQVDASSAAYNRLMRPGVHARRPGIPHNAVLGASSKPQTMHDIPRAREPSMARNRAF